MQESQSGISRRSSYSPHPSQNNNLESSKPCISSDVILSQSQSRYYQANNHNPFTNLTYFQVLRVMLKENRLFFFHQFLTGNFIKQVFKKFGLSCLCGQQSNSPDLIDSLFLKLYSKLTPRCMPNLLRPFLFGLFVPMLVWFYLNYEYVKHDFYVNSVVLKVMDIFLVVMITLFIVIGFVTGGNLNTDIWRYRSASICTEKPWIKTEEIYCADCRIIKPLRSHHCQYCQVCTPKYSKHSIVFNQCIGANNQLLYLAFQGLFFILITLILALFISPKQPLFHSFKVFIVRLIFFLVNSYLQGMSGFEFLRGLLYIVNYNCTEYQVSNWSAKPYLCTFDRSRFYNPLESTISRNIMGSLYALFGCSDDDTQNRIENWAKTHYYYPSHIRGHAQYIQLVLFYQEREQKQKSRHTKILKQLQILGQVENIGRRSSGNVELVQHIAKGSGKDGGEEAKGQNGMVEESVKGVQIHGMTSEDDIHSITEHDCRRSQQLLCQQRVNKTVA